MVLFLKCQGKIVGRSDSLFSHYVLIFSLYCFGFCVETYISLIFCLSHKLSHKIVVQITFFFQKGSIICPAFRNILLQNNYRKKKKFQRH